MAAIDDEEALFNVAADQAPAERAAFLDEACAGRPALRRRVEALLSAYGDGNCFNPPHATALHEPIGHQPGDHIGPYKLLEQIGEGGMGLVFMAEQSAPLRRRVALKIIKPGLDTRAVIARFEAERQALALMDHPNIARVYDAGATDSGRPYFVMELVRGAPITDYCRERNLPLRERLELFIEVCQAVQHAHQKGIIHRDLKPTNILVAQSDTAPVPKVIDFGVAKATTQPLTDRTLFTAFSQIIGTPLYMSPEQADLGNQDVDTRSDVYSLGVVLYELLAGTTPFDEERLRSVSHDEMRRIIREEEPPRPSARSSSLSLRERAGVRASGSRFLRERARVRQIQNWATTAAALSTVVATPRSVHPPDLAALKGDLDWIVMKALEKDRRRRYDSPSALAADLNRFLESQPVSARPPTYRDALSKWTRRHVGLVWSVAASSVLIAAGLAVSTALIAESRNAAEEQRQVAVAERNAAKAERSLAVAQRDAASYNLYVAHMRLAQHEWKQGHVAATLNALRTHEPADGLPDRRGWEWYYLKSLCHKDILTIRAHSAAVRTLATSPDGKLLASAGDDWRIRLWDTANGREATQFSGHTGPVSALAWKADGTQLASSSFDGTLRIWNPLLGKSLKTIEVVEPLRQAAWSADGTRIAASSEVEGESHLHIWDANAGKKLHTISLPSELTWSISWSPDGKYLASGHNYASGAIRIWDGETGKLTREIIDAHGHAVRTVRWSPDGTRLASGSMDERLTIWNTADWREVLSVHAHAGTVHSLAWRPSGKEIATGGEDATIVLWDAQTGEKLRTIRGHKQPVTALTWTINGNRLASGSRDGAVKLWDPAEEHAGRTLAIGHASTWSPDGRLIASMRRHWDVTGDKQPTLEIRDGSSGALVSTIAVATNPPSDDFSLMTVAWSPDGQRLAGGFSRQLQGVVKVWDVAAGKEVHSLNAHTAEARCVAWSPDGKTIVTSGLDGLIRIWNAATGEPLKSLKQKEDEGVYNVAFSPDGRLLASSSSNQRVTLWDTTNWRVALQLTRDPSGMSWGSEGQHAVAWNPSGDRLAGGGALGWITIWDAQSGREASSFHAHSGNIRSVAWSPDGTRLATGGADHRVRIWDAATGAQVLDLDGHDHTLYTLAWSPDGRRLLSGSDRGMLWDATRGYELAAEAPSNGR